MSASLLRKGLELLEATGASSSQPKKVASSARPTKQLLKRLRKKKKRLGPGRNKATVKGKVVKSALEEYRKHQAVDHFEENMRYMMSNHFVTDNTVTKKILDQNRGRKAKDRSQEEAKKKPSDTVFTEEDFQRFEREYFEGAGRV
ncbi:active regulator of SIRT1 [Anolis carolinensis]|uniref:Active regulator of SIRT1 n=1 Tax=Anolis carolinensis TaxID=28377 RepID=G1KGR8_ANOCA|nr:PREDICTED: active regulator of SIRT1 [Anolis carolinensis]|eukprot:XP_003221030.1 PREDICTED: active regulator of SIRT1 [Anolis carolinensis]